VKKYLLDTNICIFYLRGRYRLNEKLKEIGLENCFISEITLAELKYGAECSDDVSKNRKLIDGFVQNITIVPIFNCLDIFAKEKALLKKAGNLVDDFDLLIGCSAISNRLIMVTENEKHFNRIRKIQIENWINR
jgi:tRNA(fMet)-specific endonuclease VapC